MTLPKTIVKSFLTLTALIGTVVSTLRIKVMPSRTSLVAASHYMHPYLLRIRDIPHKVSCKFFSSYPRLFWDIWSFSFVYDPEQLALHDWNIKAVDLILDAKPSSVLEVGCGFGRNISYMIDCGYEPGVITGVDLSRMMLRQARIRLRGSKVKLVRANACDLPFQDHSFDAVFLSLVLMHIKPSNLKLAFDEAIRVAKRLIVILDEYQPVPATSLSLPINRYTYAHDHVRILELYGISPAMYTKYIYDKWIVILISLEDRS